MEQSTADRLDLKISLSGSIFAFKVLINGIAPFAPEETPLFSQQHLHINAIKDLTGVAIMERK
jgi:hypothetical protein